MTKSQEFSAVVIYLGLLLWVCAEGPVRTVTSRFESTSRDLRDDRKLAFLSNSVFVLFSSDNAALFYGKILNIAEKLWGTE